MYIHNNKRRPRLVTSQNALLPSPASKLHE